MDLSLSRSAVMLTVEGSADDDSDYDSEGDSDDEDDGDDDRKDMRGAVIYLRSERTEPRLGLRTEELVDPSRPPRDPLEGLGGGEGGDEDEEEEEMGEDDEKVEVLATFFFEGKKHVVAAPLDPILIIGAPPAAAAAAGQPVAPGLDTGAEGEEDPEGWDKFEEDYVLPDREELTRVTPLIEQRLESIIDEENEEKERLAALRERLAKQWRAE